MGLAALLLTTSAVLAQPPPRQSPSLPPGFTEALVAGGLVAPMAMEFTPDGRLFVAEKAGRLRVIKNGELLTRPFLSLAVDTFGDRGLMGVAFDLGFADNRHVYVFYSLPSTPVRNRVSRFTASASNADVAELDSEIVLLDDIPTDNGSHNGGAFHFGVDGKLYIGVGDGAVNRDNAQSLGSLSGKLLRINADGSIPADNPFVGEPGARAEIWAYGLRNPFTLAVRPGSGEIFINDVGAGSWEEIDLGRAGANYGWPTCEGSCSTPGMANPIHAYPHSVGCAITGGAFYEASHFPSSYRGDYFFADFMGGWIGVLDPDNSSEAASFATRVPSPVDLSVGPDGALYYLAFREGAVYRIKFRPEGSSEIGQSQSAGPPVPIEGMLCVE